VHARKAEPRWELYRLLGDPTRLRVLALCAMEELAVSELAELLGDGQPKVSRHAAALREAGLLDARRQGTWLLLRLARDAQRDPVVADALAAGQACCQADGTLGRVAEVLGARDLGTREFFARGGRPARSGPPEELGAYLRALAPLVSPRRLAVDAGTGDGALLEVLAPVFEQVIALDRSPVQLELAEARAARRAFRNVRFVRGEIDGPEVATAVAELGAGGRGGRGRRGPGSGADAVFAARVLHHAAVPSRAMAALARLARPRVAAERGGGVLILEYESHRDEALREQQADLWLGFAPEELVRLCAHSGLEQVEQLRLPQPWCGTGADRHLAWQLVIGWRGLPGRRVSSEAVGQSS
jgi:DNA-binding transcriptional ArsR family regulator